MCVRQVNQLQMRSSVNNDGWYSRGICGAVEDAWGRSIMVYEYEYEYSTHGAFSWYTYFYITFICQAAFVGCSFILVPTY